jgi:hypothetical protein
LLQLKLLSLRRAAQCVGLSPITLKAAAANGDVSVVSLNGRIRFEQTALANWAFDARRTACREATPKVGRLSTPAKENNADWLGYSERTVTGWAVAWHDSGGTDGLPCRRLGRRKWSFIEAEVQAWLDAGGLLRSAAPAPKPSAGPKAAPVTRTGTS